MPACKAVGRSTCPDPELAATNVPDVMFLDVSISVNMRASGCGSDHVVFASGTCRGAIVSDAQTISRPSVGRTISPRRRNELFRRASEPTVRGMVVEEGDQAVVTTMAQHVEVP